MVITWTSTLSYKYSKACSSAHRSVLPKFKAEKKSPNCRDSEKPVNHQIRNMIGFVVIKNISAIKIINTFFYILPRGL